MSHLGPWYLDKDSTSLKKGVETIPLKPIEWKLLHHFICHPNNCFTIEELKIQVWKQAFLSDSAVKKAISELRKSLKTKIKQDVVVTHAKEGYQLGEFWMKQGLGRSDKMPQKAIAISLIMFVAVIFGLAKNLSSSTTDNANESLSKEAYSLYLKGKVAYYDQADTDFAIKLFEESLSLQQDTNPSSAALLDIYGLKARSLILPQRKGAINERLLAQVARVSEYQENVENAVALSKYALVNLGDFKRAKSYLDQSTGDFHDTHDLHIPAYVYALNGDKVKSLELINFAEQRYPASGVIAWYKGLIFLVLNEFNELKTQSEWAQQIAPDWYPLVYVAMLLKNADHQKVISYLSSIPQGIFANFATSEVSIEQLVAAVCQKLDRIDVRPYETEILYLLSISTAQKEHQNLIHEFIKNNYPEKLMLLPFLETWLNTPKTST